MLCARRLRRKGRKAGKDRDRKGGESLSLRRIEGSRQGRHGEQGHSCLRVGNGQDRAPGRSIHGPVHPEVPLDQEKEQRKRSGEKISGDNQSSDVSRCSRIPLWSCSPSGRAEHRDKDFTGNVKCEWSKVFMK